MTRVHYFNYLIKIKVNIEDNIALIGDFKNWDDFEDKQIEYLKNKSKKLKLKSSILLFRKNFLNNGIFNTKNIIKIAKRQKIDNVIIYDYNENYLNFDQKDLFNNIVNELSIKKTVIANNYYECKIFNTDFFVNNFSTNNLLFGDFKLKSYKYNNIQLIKENKFEEFKINNKLMYMFDGIVEKGKQLGRKIGFPTINIVFNKDNKLLINHGVYACKVYIENLDYIFIGAGCYWKNELDQDVFEVNLFDFDKEIYGWKVTIEPVKWIRNGIKVNSLDELILLLKNDVSFIKLLKINKETYE
ncbi:riboflavin kinase / FMN adenylyltransferase [Spiroplasma corruscae]|uniref:riboflavin kinase n=1 Tax=Spiroplasma corruscae TaxID=216934 RepID=A0A222EPD9_9MOLU|nr:riboflavin kinase [Spiroplasma corruscae]ASP28261.1 riboflavin kinase / FMN adenylyltransferase [Spiroplasma corruscae]